jgi:hypothetical protein
MCKLLMNTAVEADKPTLIKRNDSNASYCSEEVH